jgi:glycosyltransferase involved in cell wall biosynthesis
MIYFTISFKTKTNLISSLLNQENIKELEKKLLFSKLFTSNKNFADIYFHSGNIDKNAIENIKNAKVIIVNSQNLKHKIILQTNIDASKVHVVYPSIDLLYDKPKTIKKNLCEELNIDSKKRLILFTAKNFEKAGIKEFIQIIASLGNDNFHVLIAGDKREITSLKFKMSKINLFEHITLLEDYEDVDSLFLASDIFILPSHIPNFATNVLKAMFCKCAVFVTSLNDSNELVDVFATMDEPDDRSMAFKVDALLSNKDDLKLIKKENRKKALKYSLENNLKRLNEIIANI